MTDGRRRAEHCIAKSDSRRFENWRGYMDKIDNLDSAVRQYRHAVHGSDCECQSCRTLLKILVSENYELVEPKSEAQES